MGWNRVKLGSGTSVLRFTFEKKWIYLCMCRCVSCWEQGLTVSLDVINSLCRPGWSETWKSICWFLTPRAFQISPEKGNVLQSSSEVEALYEKGCTCSSSVPERTVFFLLQCSQDPVGLLHDWSMWHDSVLHLDPGSSSSQAQVFPISKDWKRLTHFGLSNLVLPSALPWKISLCSVWHSFLQKKIGALVKESSKTNILFNNIVNVFYRGKGSQPWASPC